MRFHFSYSFALQALMVMLCASLIFLSSSCTKEQQLTNQLEGTWQIDKYSGNGQNEESKAADLQATFDATDAGELQLNEDGSGTYQFNYDMDITGNALGVSIENTIQVNSSGTLEWSNDENSVTITYTSGDREGEEDDYNVDERGDDQQEWSGESEQQHNYNANNSAKFIMETSITLSKN